MPPPSRRAAHIALILTAALWGSNAVVARGLLDAVAPVWLATLRWTIVLALLAPFVWRDRGAIAAAFRDDPRGLAWFALLGFAPQNMLVYGGLSGTTAINFGLLNSAIPVLIVAVVAISHRRRPRAIEMAGLALSLAGVLAIVAQGSLSVLARLEFNPNDLVVMAAMLVWSIYTVRLAERSSALPFPAFMFAAGAMGLALSLPAVVWQAAIHGSPALDAGSLWGIAYIAALPTLAAMLLFGYGLARVGAVQAGIFTHLVPVFAALFATLAIGERLHAYHALGFALVAGGAIVCCLAPAPVLSSRPGGTRAQRLS